MSSIRLRTWRISNSVTDPTLPLTVSTRSTDTDRMCWHWAEESAWSPVPTSAMTRTSEPNSRSVVVRGTTWITFADSSSISWAVTTTTGCLKPASRPAGAPRSRSTTSPEVSIEPVDLVFGERTAQLFADPLLSQATGCDCDRFTDCGPELTCQSFQLFVSLPVNTDAGAWHAI